MKIYTISLVTYVHGKLFELGAVTTNYERARAIADQMSFRATQPNYPIIYNIDDSYAADQHEEGHVLIQTWKDESNILC